MLLLMVKWYRTVCLITALMRFFHEIIMETSRADLLMTTDGAAYQYVPVGTEETTSANGLILLIPADQNNKGNKLIHFNRPLTEYGSCLNYSF